MNNNISTAALGRKHKLSWSGVKYRLDAGIPLSAPKAGGGRGGNYTISEQTAREIWAAICNKRACKTAETTPQIAKRFKAKLSVVNNIAYGKSWNSITGLPRPEDDS
ncbi:hypothetical protein [Arsukibacterium sp.]|uniref:hypothetical protein n=1 Tax=Arsukibacterium sp. TaxID=1977258 RepID=UPI00299E0FE2|nr:hypothetical protein [Arsukibacterium sp.]MDX1538864.1 hypothetical protein [Arsukibacterium sp.]